MTHRALVIGTGLWAAEVPASAVDAADAVVRGDHATLACADYGSGYVRVPGSDACLELNGAALSAFTARSRVPSRNPYTTTVNIAGDAYPDIASSFRARGFVGADARAGTGYGPMRAYVSYRPTIDSVAFGPVGGGTVVRRGDALPRSTGFFQGYAQPGSQPILDKGFVQVGGLTAGVAPSFFDFDHQRRELQAASLANSNQITTLVAFETPTDRDGLSAAASIEDRDSRVIGDGGFEQANLNPTGTRAGYLAYAGATVPDLVARLALDRSWGSAQLSAAYHQASSRPVMLPDGRTVAPPPRDGFAALAGIGALLPFLGHRDNGVIQATVERGAMDYLNPENYLNGINNINVRGLSIAVPVDDGFVLPGGRIGCNTGYGLYAAVQHYWTAPLDSSLFGDAVRIRNPAAAQRLAAAGDDAAIRQAGVNLVWTPLRDLHVGGELVYSRLHLSGLFPLSSTTSGSVPTPTPAISSDLRGRLSLVRAF